MNQDNMTTEIIEKQDEAIENEEIAAGETTDLGESHTEAETIPDSQETVTDVDPEDIAAHVEAIIVTSEKAISAAKIAEVLNIGIDRGGSKPIIKAVDILNGVYEETGRTFRIERVAGGFRLMTLAAYSETIAKEKESRTSTKLSQPALETLAITAYRQPITRADIEIIRGVSCGEILRSLLERHLIKITGRAEEVGRPMLYGTTRHFLEAFGLSSLKDLPDSRELQQP